MQSSKIVMPNRFKYWAFLFFANAKVKFFQMVQDVNIVILA